MASGYDKITKLTRRIGSIATNVLNNDLDLDDTESKTAANTSAISANLASIAVNAGDITTVNTNLAKCISIYELSTGPLATVDATPILVPWDSKIQENGGIVNVGGVFTVPKDGLYSITTLSSFGIYTGASTEGVGSVWLKLNGGSNVLLNSIRQTTTVNFGTSIEGSCIRDLLATNTIEIYVQTNSTAATVSSYNPVITPNCRVEIVRLPLV